MRDIGVLKRLSQEHLIKGAQPLDKRFQALVEGLGPSLSPTRPEASRGPQGYPSFVEPSSHHSKQSYQNELATVALRRRCPLMNRHLEEIGGDALWVKPTLQGCLL